MKTSLAVRLTTVLFTVFLLSQQSFAQAPTISTNVGMPTGVVSTNGVAYGNSIYVSIQSTNTVYTSADGEVWAKVTDLSVPAGTFRSITFGAGVFVVVGGDGLIMTSANGTTWTTRVSGTTDPLWNVEFLQGAFYTVGSNRAFRTSTNGITWTGITIGAGVGTSTDMLMNITYGNGAFAVAARSSVGGSGIFIYRSTTAASNSWTFQNINFGLINKAQFLKDRFYVFCSNTNIYTSTDAITWTNSTASLIATLPNASTQQIGSPNQVFHGIYDGTKIYLFGYSQYHDGYGSIFSSTNGVNFTLQPRTAYLVCQSSFYINNKYFQCGNESIASSADGINYHYSSGSYTGLASSGSNYVGVGAVGDAGLIFTSSDYTAWTDRTPAGQKPLNAVTYNGSKFLAVGNKTVMESVNNGLTWTEIATTGDNFVGVAYGSSVFVAGVYDAATYASRILYSATGSSWTEANTDDNWYFKIKYINGHFFALGSSNSTYLGVILHSTDGISWTDITPALPFPVYFFNDVVYDGSKYHFMGMEYIDIDNWVTDFFSVSTATVTNPASFSNKGTISSPPGITLGGSYGEGAFAYSSGRFVGAVSDLNTNDVYVVYSYDGITWTPMPINEKSYIYGALAEGNRFRILGAGDAKITVTFSGITLPVVLTQFTASLKNGQSLLKWQTASEQNSHRFAVQHSTDASIWQTIGTVMAAGQSQELRDYQFVHTHPQKGNNYYRIIQTDIDGREQISAVRKVTIGESLSISLYPNPAREWAMLQLPGTGTATVSLFNISGQQVYSKVHTEKNIRLPLQQLPRGAYQVVVDQNGKRYTEKLSKQ